MSQRKLWVAFFIGLLALALRVQPALAHEEIMIGDYTVKIGWLSEPPVVGLQNAIVVHVVTASDEQPVEDVSGLTVAISYGGQDKTLSLQPLGEDAPGQFAATIIPTVPGSIRSGWAGR